MTERNLDARRSRLSPEQQALLQARLKGNSPDKGEQITPSGSEDKAIALSNAQQRLWFLWQYDPLSTAYHLAGGLTLQGQLDMAALQQAFGQLLARHPSFRTVFRVNGEGEATQQLCAADSLPPLRIDTITDSTALAAAQHSLTQTPFDLCAGPAWRATLFQLGAQQYQLVLVIHHILSDGWSVQLLMDELATLYRASVQQETAALVTPAINYLDYTQWQRQWLQGPGGKSQLAYWQAQLGGEQPVLQLPADHPRHPDGRYQAARHTAALPASLIQRLREQAQTTGGTLFMSMLAAWQAQLSRLTGLTDIRVGVPIANRHRSETTHVSGFFVNTQVLRAKLGQRMTLASLLAQTREHALAAQTQQDLPFDTLVEALQPQRTPGTPPLFQIMFNHLRQDRRHLQGWPQLQVERLDFDAVDAQFECTLQILEQQDGSVIASFDYARELFDADTVARWAGHYLAMLDALANAPETAIADVALLSESEQQCLRDWGVNETRYPDVKPVHELFEAQVAANPQAIALIFGETELTYRELDSRANRLAHQLLAQGIKREARIGIALERSIEMVVGLLAILKAGAAYVPLDPDYPADRLAHMVDDAGLILLLTHSALVDQLPAANVPVVLVDVVPEADYPASKPAVNVHPEQLAYVIYTSGSTGKPKGVAIRHAALHNFLLSMQQKPGLNSTDVVLALTSLNFDIAGLELYLPLSIGARTVLALREHALDGTKLRALLHEQHISVVQATPSGWRMLLSATGQPLPAGLKALCGGEALHADLISMLQAEGATLWNMYGPTETTIWSAVYPVQSTPLIGQAIAATQCRVLDADLALVPPGVAGELYLGGYGLARGYLNRAGLTSERFIADPFDANGGRLYRTGDLVRWNSEGQLEYLGRIDHQVKIRGFRIELGEIEAQLLAQGVVREAVVVARHDDGNARLVAYVSLKDGETTDAANLKAAIATTLPDYMLPSAIVLLDALPLNPNGKVDRKALPAPEFTAAGEYVAPEGEVETKLAAIWAEVLGVAQVGRHDSFFELGGHSLLAVQLVARVQTQWKLPLEIRQVFAQPTLSGQAALLATFKSPAIQQASLNELDAFMDSLL